MKSILQNSSGNTLIQVLLATGISSVVVAGTTAFLTNSHRQVATVTHNLEKESLLSDLRLALSSSEICNSLSFVGRDFSGKVLELNELSQGGRIILDKKAKHGVTKVKKISLEKSGSVLFTKKIGLPEQTVHLYPVVLKIQTEKNAGALQIVDKEKEISFYLYLNSQNSVQSCFGGYENSQAQQNCELLLGGSYKANPGLNKPSCLLKPAIKDFEGVKLRNTTAFAKTAVFVNGTGKVAPWTGGFNEYTLVAPDCPSQTVPVSRRLHMVTEAGQDQVFDVMSFDIDGGEPFAAAHDIPVSWYFTYFDYKNLDVEGRPRCTLRIAHPTSNGAWAEWSPRVSCAAQSERMLEP